MRNLISLLRISFIIVILIIISPSLISQSVGINTDESPPDQSALLDLKSTTKGFLPPRLTSTQIGEISDPADGLIVYNQTTGCLNYYKKVGLTCYWSEVCGIPICLPECLDLTTCIDGECVSCCFNNGGSACWSAVNIGDVCGENDETSLTIDLSGCGSAWYIIDMIECDETDLFGLQGLQFRAELLPPYGMNYDLYLYSYPDCSTVIDSSTNIGGIGFEIVEGPVVDDIFGEQVIVRYFLEVRYISGGACEDWSLSIFGNGI